LLAATVKAILNEKRREFRPDYQYSGKNFSFQHSAFFKEIPVAAARHYSAGLNLRRKVTLRSRGWNAFYLGCCSFRQESEKVLARALSKEGLQTEKGENVCAGGIF